MIRLGRVYRGNMVHMRATNAKLRRRAEAMICQIVGCDPADAALYLGQGQGDVKTAVLLGFGLTPAEAAVVLERHKGNLRPAIDELARNRDGLGKG
jgi:N-acetylmuramic acid 6-phosphate etherase